MVLSEFEIKRVERELNKFLDKRRPPAHIRKEVDLGYRIDGQSVEIIEIRPNWRDPSASVELPVAKATHVKTTKSWKIYWQRADLKWHSYQPTPVVNSIEEFLQLVDEDANHCFFG